MFDADLCHHGESKALLLSFAPPHGGTEVWRDVQDLSTVQVIDDYKQEIDVVVSASNEAIEYSNI